MIDDTPLRGHIDSTQHTTVHWTTAGPELHTLVTTWYNHETGGREELFSRNHVTTAPTLARRD